MSATFLTEPPKLVIFDCDGVLVDSETLANQVFAQVVTAEGLPTTFEESVARYMGRSLADAIADIEAALGRPVGDSFVADYDRQLHARLRSELVAVAGVRQLLDALVTANVPRCVASSGRPQEIALRLELTGLTEYFGRHVYSATMVARGKPAPDLFCYAAEQVGVDASTCVVIEDSPFGVRGAKAAGMTTIGYAALMPVERLIEAGADIVVTDMSEIPRLLAL